MISKRIIGKLVAVLLTMTILSVNIFVSAEGFDESEIAIDENIPTVSIDEIDESYSSYLSLYADKELSKIDIIQDLDNALLDTQPLEFEIVVENSGLYNIGLCYKCLDDSMADVRIGLKIDGEYPYDKAEKIDFPRMWCNEEGEALYDDAGNEYAPQQVQYLGYFYNEAIDETVQNGDKFIAYLAEGTHKITILPVRGKIEIDYFAFASTSNPANYKEPADKKQLYSDEPIIIEGEDAIIKSSYFLGGKNNNSSTLITPQSPYSNLINYIGGGNWSSVGDTLVWETPELKEGYYKIGFSFLQSSIIGGKSYRVLSIDGEVPFAEATEVGFKYDTGWQHSFFETEDDKPYLVYFSEGKHEIALTVTASQMGQVRTLLTKAVAELGDLYVDMTKITGETVDIYRDYELFKQIDDMEERLNSSRKLLVEAKKLLIEVTSEETGSNVSIIDNMVFAIDNMLENKFQAHRHKDYYYTNYCSVSSVLQDLSSMPLSIDKIVLCAAEEEDAFNESNFVDNFFFSVKRFLVSFTRDYNAISDADTSDKSITIWVNWGRDQAQVLTSLVDRSFTPKTGIDVNLKLVNATIIQAVLSGKGPDCILMHPRSEPVNLAMRGVLYDLTKFDDYESVLERFQKGAADPYYYKNGLYALPDTQTFFAMFYRTDIFEEYEIEVPETWKEFDIVAKLLMRNNMNVSLPATVVVDATTAGGVGTNNIYPSLLAQNNISLYKDGGKSTNLLSPDAMTVFEQWTDYYKKLKVPVTMDFYNRFRVGTTPIGIASYTLYTQLESAAPEIRGLWSVAPIPGTVREDGTISHASAGGGTGCSILNTSKNPEYAWEFLKWWTSTDTQLSYSNNIESILGPIGRVALSNVEAIKSLTWEEEALDNLLEAWGQVEEVPEYPGSYYVARSIYQAFWNVVNDNKNTKDMLVKFGAEANDEIARKWEQYTDRK